ncbi:sigma 54-interacting transcriptional regulator [Paenibacillus sp. DXFW5]|uniref:Sigma 54-interacting transcriptional regulator n=1 Tax=Paenibacillus rhizolycopersici TaxID=2780073 RepID=A0ABS2H9J7_9BACL|nr:sigma 54-interacting transcriptional regulator [Paenibacillus rhizolycopersici]MBM6996173.1 sigma 54-interacting transcriptional regulator [Paenibacillus rhizolycopersici]
MFNHERILIRRELTRFEPDEKMSVLLAALQGGQASTVELGRIPYLLTPDDAGLLEAFGGGSIGEGLRLDRTRFAVSTVFRESDLALPVNELASRWYGADASGRPALVVNDELEPIGYLPLVDLLKLAADRQQRAEAYFDALLETVSDAVTVVDRNGTVIGWNAVAEEVYGIAKTDIVGRTIGEHFDPDALVVLSILDEGRRLRGAYHRPREGTHVLINASPIVKPGGGIIGGVATEQDITHLVKLNDELTVAASRLLTQRAHDEDPFALISGRGESMGKVIKLAKKLAENDSAVLLIGETGAGKEQLAKVIHRAGARAEGPFLSLSCGAVPAGLAEAELFGYQGGAFSGQPSGQAGRLESADGGSIFLNEIECLPPDVQEKLAQYIKRHKVTRIGASEAVPVSVRIFAGTSQDLEQLVREGKFRTDLYYALNVVSLKVPPLRERREDLGALVQMYLRVFSLQYQKALPTVSPEVMLAFANYDWPGNVSELRAVIERCVILSDNEQITLEHLPEVLQRRQAQLEYAATGNADTMFVGTADGSAATKTEQTDRLDKMLRPRITPEEEMELMKEALERTSGNKSNAAKLLGISRGTLYKKIRDYNLV